MLIDDRIKWAITCGNLVPARPILPWAGEPRAFLMCNPLHRSIKQGRMSLERRSAQRWAQLEADIGHFVQGGLITEHRLKQLDPAQYEHWELRSLKPRPSLRVFGRFAKPNVFIGTHVIERKSLGEKWSISWEMEKLACEDYWRDAGLEAPFSAERYEDYITENATRTLKV